LKHHSYTVPTVGIILGGSAFVLSVQYPGDVFYPSGPWYDIPELVVNLEEEQVLRYKSRTPRPRWKLSAMEKRRFNKAPDITKLRDNRKELTRLKNGGKYTP